MLWFSVQVRAGPPAFVWSARKTKAAAPQRAARRRAETFIRRSAPNCGPASRKISAQDFNLPSISKFLRAIPTPVACGSRPSAEMFAKRTAARTVRLPSRFSRWGNNGMVAPVTNLRARVAVVERVANAADGEGMAGLRRRLQQRRFERQDRRAVAAGPFGKQQPRARPGSARLRSHRSPGRRACGVRG